ncbi:hypothetical protein RB195_008974 [Necator americanus]|uniref:Uncharacterized protein n=1 Tax=Necator americanus TaxID=51031 RepID=A0ABR1CT28_NECAM
MVCLILFILSEWKVNSVPLVEHIHSGKESPKKEMDSTKWLRLSEAEVQETFGVGTEWYGISETYSRNSRE